MRIALIHALRQSSPPIEEAFARLWPSPVLRNIMDDSLSADLERQGSLRADITSRFLALGRYAISSGADAILFTCSAFGASIDAVAADLAPLPVRKPTEAMVADAGRRGGRMGLVASFAPTLASMAGDFPASVEVIPILVAGALDVLARGDAAEHDRLVIEAAQRVDVDFYALAQFSIARTARLLKAGTAKDVLTTPDAAVRELARSFAVEIAN